jgi:hypothetical protein
VNSGVEATRIPASPDEISSSPAPISRNGPATWTAPSRATVQIDAPFSFSWSRYAATGSSTSAARKIRTQATIAGERSRTPILMNM